MTLVTPENSVGILQREIAFTSASSTRPILGSHWIATCLVLIAFNSITQKAALAHFDGPSKLEPAINQIKEKISASFEDNLLIHIVCLNIGTNTIYPHIKATLPSNWKIASETNSSCVAFNSKTGQLITPVKRNNLGELSVPFKERTALIIHSIFNETNKYKQMNTVYDGIDNPNSQEINKDYSEAIQAFNKPL